MGGQGRTPRNDFSDQVGIMRLTILSLLCGLALPGAGGAAEVFTHCAELPSRRDGLVPIAWFEVMGGGVLPTPAAKASGHYDGEELNGKTVSCTVGGHEYAFGLMELRDVGSVEVPFEVYRARLLIDGTEVWASDEIPADPQTARAMDNYTPFIGTVRIAGDGLEVCKVGTQTDIAHYIDPFYEWTYGPDGTPIPPEQMVPRPLLKPDIRKRGYLGFRYGCEVSSVRIPEG